MIYMSFLFKFTVLRVVDKLCVAVKIFQNYHPRDENFANDR